MIRRPPRSTQGVSSAASDVYKRQVVALPNLSAHTQIRPQILLLVQVRVQIVPSYWGCLDLSLLRSEENCTWEIRRVPNVKMCTWGIRRAPQRANLYVAKDSSAPVMLHCVRMPIYIGNVFRTEFAPPDSPKCAQICTWEIRRAPKRANLHVGNPTCSKRANLYVGNPTSAASGRSVNR